MSCILESNTHAYEIFDIKGDIISHPARAMGHGIFTVREVTCSPPAYRPLLLHVVLLNVIFNNHLHYRSYTRDRDAQ